MLNCADTLILVDNPETTPRALPLYTPFFNLVPPLFGTTSRVSGLDGSPSVNCNTSFVVNDWRPPPLNENVPETLILSPSGLMESCIDPLSGRMVSVGVTLRGRNVT